MKTLSAVIFIVTATLTGCAHTGYHGNGGGYGYGYGGGYGSGYTVERYYGSPSYNYYYPPQRSYHNHGHDHDRQDVWRHHQHKPVIDRHDVEPRTRPWGGGDRTQHHDGQQRDGNRDFNRPRNDEQKGQGKWGDSSQGGRRGRRSDGNPKRDDDGHFGRRRD